MGILLVQFPIIEMKEKCCLAASLEDISTICQLKPLLIVHLNQNQPSPSGKLPSLAWKGDWDYYLCCLVGNAKLLADLAIPHDYQERFDLLEKEAKTVVFLSVDGQLKV